MRYVKIFGILFAGLLAGIITGLVVADLLTRPQAGDIPAYVDAASGFLMFLCIGGGLTISVPFSVLFAIWSWRKSAEFATGDNKGQGSRP